MAEKRTTIPPKLKEKIWKTYIGNSIESKCPICEQNVITAFSFEAGHVVSEANGGSLDLPNLRAICGSCNSSMGKKDLRDYTKEFYSNSPILLTFENVSTSPSKDVKLCTKCHINVPNLSYKWCQQCYENFKTKPKICTNCKTNIANISYKWCQMCYEKFKTKDKIQKNGHPVDYILDNNHRNKDKIQKDDKTSQEQQKSKNSWEERLRAYRYERINNKYCFDYLTNRELKTILDILNLDQNGTKSVLEARLSKNRDKLKTLTLNQLNFIGSIVFVSGEIVISSSNKDEIVQLMLSEFESVARDRSFCKDELKLILRAMDMNVTGLYDDLGTRILSNVYKLYELELDVLQKLGKNIILDDISDKNEIITQITKMVKLQTDKNKSSTEKFNK